MGQGGDSSPTTGTGGVPVGISISINTSTPLIGDASFQFSHDMASQGQGVSTDFIINNVDRNKTLQISFFYRGTSGMVLGTSSDIQVFIYDIDLAVLIPVTPKYIVGPTLSDLQYVGQFETSSSVNYRLIFHVATTSAVAFDFLFDQVIVNNILNAVTATQVPSVVLQEQPISGSVTDHMAVIWIDGATQWVPATSSYNGDYWGMLGFATNIIGLTADVFVDGYMDGFSFGPFVGYNQYIDPVNPGLLTPLPSPFTDKYVIMGKSIDAFSMNIQVFKGIDLIVNGSGTPIKGGLLSNNGANDGTGDLALSVGANGNVLVANSGATLGINWAPAVVASAPFTYTTATRTLTAATATNAVAGFLSAADHTLFNAKQSATLTSAHILVGNGSNVASDVALTGDVAITNAGVSSITSATVTGKLITGFVSGSGVVAATDTILQAFNKINGNDLLKAPLASPSFTGDVSTTGNVLINTLGKTLGVKTGTNSKVGLSVLVAGSVVVSNTSITANSRIFCTSNLDGGSIGFVRVSAKSVGTSFTITSSNASDTSSVAWFIVESIP
jgi:hypothetical protein